MTIAAGLRFGPFEVIEPIGSGGMGVVYRATDTNLNRDVAVKVLPESLTGDADRVARFRREAELLASLNHAQIAQIYGIETSADAPVLVMELVEGMTLAERLEHGPIPLDESLDIARQIAAGLEAAHARGIVHRDLKPANVKLQPDGLVKILDFGLAKALESPASPPPSSMLSPAMTMAGMVLGTAAYMAPEQAKGKLVDERADVWAFGCVLYEMLTGQPAFGAEDVTSTLARVLERDVDMRRLPAGVPPAVRRTLELTLEKDVKRRIADIRDVVFALDGAFETPSANAGVAGLRPRVAAVAVVAALIAGGAATLWLQSSLAPERPAAAEAPSPVRFSMSDAPSRVDAGFAFSPDGRRIVFAATPADGGPTRLYQRSMDSAAPTLIAGTEGAVVPFFSPDGEWVAFAGTGELRRVRLDGGGASTIADLPTAFMGAAWLDDGTIVYSMLGSNALWRVPAAGGEAVAIEAVGLSGQPRWPAALPVDDHVLVTVWNNRLSEAAVGIQSLATGEVTRLAPGMFPRYASTGHVVYWFQDALWALPFDGDALEPIGDPVPVVQDVAAYPYGRAAYDLGRGGALAFLAGTASIERQIVWVDSDGAVTPLWDELREYALPTLSPDGGRLAVAAFADNNMDIWIFDIDRGIRTRLTTDPARDDDFVWSHDGVHIYFESDRGGAAAIYRVRADGSADPELVLLGSGNSVYPTSVSPDGRLLAYSEDVPPSGPDIWIKPLAADGRGEPFVRTDASEWGAEFSPDGRWIAYHGLESGIFEIFVRPMPPGAGRFKLSLDGGMQPRWSGDGRSLYYRSATGIMKVPVDPVSGAFSFGRPEVVLEGDFAGGQSGVLTDGERYPDYDVAGNGDRFVMLTQSVEGRAGDSLNVVLNWYTELRALFPGSAAADARE